MRTVEEDLFGAKNVQSINSKVKGDRNELMACKILTAWTGSEFVRIPRSGGLKWQNTVSIRGDVISANPCFDFPFTVETKDYANLTITETLRQNSIVYGFWDQVKSDSLMAQNFPILMLRNTGERPRKKYTIFLENLKEIRTLLAKHKVKIISTGSRSGYNIIGVNSINLFANVTYESIVRAHRKASAHRTAAKLHKR